MQTNNHVMFFLSLSQARLDVGVALLSTHRLIWRDSKNHVSAVDHTKLSYFVF